MMGHKVCFFVKMWLIIPKSSLLPLFIWSSVSSCLKSLGVDVAVQTDIQTILDDNERQWSPMYGVRNPDTDGIRKGHTKHYGKWTASAYLNTRAGLRYLGSTASAVSQPL